VCAWRRSQANYVLCMRSMAATGAERLREKATGKKYKKCWARSRVGENPDGLEDIDFLDKEEEL
jgi:hypothetical protein